MGKKQILIFIVSVAAFLVLHASAGLSRTSFDDNTGATVQDDSGQDNSQTEILPDRDEVQEVQTAPVRPVPTKARGRSPAQSTSDNPEREAEKFFRPNAPSDSPTREPQDDDSGVGPENHYLAIGVGGYLNSDAYQWGQTPHNTNAGRLLGELTYRIAPLSQLADWALRADLIGYSLPEGSATQLAISPVLMFPDSGSKFPLYFGLGVGPGVFFSQISQESFLALNYQVFAGVRFFNVLPSAGFFGEIGLKNHMLLLSDGQFNGSYLAVGAVFMF